MSTSTNADISWNVLLESIKNGLKDNKVNKVEVSRLLTAYESQEQDWMQYVFFDERCYTRNLVDMVDGNYSLVIMAWNPDQKTNIHNHSGSSCFVKILDGALREIKYKTPEECKPFKEIENHVRERNNVLYIDDSVAVHELINDSASQAISLHLFIPPLDTYKFYDRDTAETIQVAVTFTSAFGIAREEGYKHNMPKDTSP